MIGQELTIRSNKPFSSTYSEETVPYGKTIKELVFYSFPDEVYQQYVQVTINGDLIPRENWRCRPKPGTRVCIVPVPGGGGGRLFAQIGLTVLTIAALHFLGPFGAVGVQIGGQLLLSQLLPPPVPKQSKGLGVQTPVPIISGGQNQYNRWGKVPFILGRLWSSPYYAATPYSEIVGNSTYWRALFCLGHGPLTFDTQKIGDTPIENFQEVEIEVRRGYWSFRNRGYWDASTGVFPNLSDLVFGDQFIVSTGRNIAGYNYTPGQTITFNGLVPPTNPNCWDIDQEKPFVLYPNDVNEESLQVNVLYGTPEVRSSVVGADELAIQIVFSQGLYYLQNNPPGKPGDYSVSITIQQSPFAQNNWTTVTSQTITGRQSTPLYWGWRWNTSLYGAQDVNKQYDVKFIRNTGTDPNHTVFDQLTWFSLRTITVGSPVPSLGIGMVAMRIKASGQLQGVINNYNMIIDSICKDYDAASRTWIWRQTKSPAALYRHALQHPMARDEPVPDSRIDLQRLQDWDGFCRGKGFNIGGVIDQSTSTWDVLTTIALVGQASPTLRELNYSVVVDQPQTTPVRMFSPRNCWNYEGEIDHSPLPHAYRVSFLNEEVDWKPDEVLVFDDGYNETNSTRYERLEWNGISNRNLAWRRGRYHIAQTRLRREIHHIDTDFEHLACERGDLVAFQHDAIAVGIGTARIISSDAHGCAIDVPVEMEDGKSYGFRCRGIDASTIQTVTNLFKVNTDSSGLVKNLTFPSPVTFPPGVGEMISFGEYNRETMRVLIKDISPGPNLTARLTLIAEGAGVHTADTGTIPPYDPVVTLPRTLPDPVIISIESGARVMLVASRVLITRVIFLLQPISIQNTHTYVMFRLTGTDAPWTNATVQEETVSTVAITGVVSGEIYDFRLIRTHPDYLTSAATSVNAYRVIGRSDPPRGLQNFRLSISGGQALLQWELPEDLDVQYGGWIIFRHSVAMENATWANSTSIGRTINGDQIFVWLPLKAGTYMGRVYDIDGLESTEIVYFSTKNASILNYVQLAYLTEEPDFSGAKVNCEVVDDELQLISTVIDFDSIPDVDSMVSWDIGGETVTPLGSYKFGTGFDFGTVSRIRITSHIVLEAINQYALMDSEELMDSDEDIDGTSGAPVDAEVWARFTDDSPTGIGDFDSVPDVGALLDWDAGGGYSPTWTAATRVDALEINHRAVGDITCYLASADPVYNLRISELRLLAHVVV